MAIKQEVKQSQNNLSPFYLVRMGATIDSIKNQFTPPVLPDTQTLSIFIGGKHVETGMTGDSSYVYNDKLNQGSLGFNGEFGASVISKVTAAVSGYVGKASADTDQSININYEVKMISGVEVIDFSRITPQNLFTALNKGPKEDAEDALVAYIALNKQLNGRDLIEALKDRDAPQIQTLLNKWTSEVQSFFASNGEGMVVGIIWGGIGMVKLNIHTKQSQSQWKYGGKGSFSYAKTTSSFSVEAAYDGSQQDKRSSVTSSATSIVSGACVGPQVEKWLGVVEGKAFAQIAEIKLLDSAPSVSSVANFPNLPAFKVPKKDPSIADKFAQITTMDGLKGFAMASAYDKRPSSEAGLSLDDFIKKANEPANNNALEHTATSVTESNVNTLGNRTLKLDDPSQSSKLEYFKQAEISTDKPAYNDFTPLGVWVSNWADLFPWLATGYLNELKETDTTGINETLKKQCMLQDLLALAKIYRCIDACGQINASELKMEPFSQIAISFTQGAYKLQNESTTIKKVFEGLSNDAQKIYTHWNDIKFLRNAELGLGILVENSISDKCSLTDKVVSSSGTYPDTILNLKIDTCNFSAKSENFNAFASFLKLIPLVTPDGSVYVFGPRDMMVQKVVDNKNISFSKKLSTALKFEGKGIDKVNKLLKSGSMTLYPIPFAAAEGLGGAWKGQGLSTNLGSMKTLQGKLKKIQNDLATLKVYSFSSDTWKNKDIEDAYGMRAVKATYIGIVEEIGGVF